jgi:glycerophosphoryl diester phosphodiesterase
VELARADYSYRIGWVLSDYSARSHRRAQALGPDFLFINLKKVSADEPLFPGPWTWAVYEVGSADQALAWFARGARLVESFQACELARELEQADQA